MERVTSQVFHAIAYSVAIFALCTSCGSGDRLVSTPHAFPTTSEIVLTSPPDSVSSGKISGITFYSDSNDIKFVRGGIHSITVPGHKILAASMTIQGGTSYLLVASIDNQGHCKLFRYNDETGDYIPDATTETMLVDFGTTPAYVTKISAANAGLMFVLDRRCQDIRVLVDTNADGWVDTVKPTPYAKSDDYSGLLEARSVLRSGDAATYVYATDYAPANLLDILEPPGLSGTLRFEDSNGDLVADSMTVMSAMGISNTPRLQLVPYDGLTSISVGSGQGRANGQEVQVWSLDASGGDIAQLGSATFGSGSNTPVTISLSSALQTGQFLGVRYKNKQSSQIAIHVVAAVPQVASVTPRTVAPNETTVVTVKGHNFGSSTTFKLRTGAGPAVTLSSTPINANTATVTIPSMPYSSPGAFELFALAPGQDPSVTIPPRTAFCRHQAP